MHELSIAKNILEVAREHLPADSSAAVRNVRLRVGDLAGIVPESLEFCFKVLAAGTGFEGSRLTIERVPVVVECRRCGTRSGVDGRGYLCASCGFPDVVIVHGRELEIVSIELDDDASVHPVDHTNK